MRVIIIIIYFLFFFYFFFILDHSVATEKTLSQQGPCRTYRAHDRTRCALVVRPVALWALVVRVVARSDLRAPGFVVETRLLVVVNSILTENSLSRQRFFPPWPNCVTTSNPVATESSLTGPKSCHDTRPLSRCRAKELCRDREILYHDPNRLACPRAVSRHKKPCCDTDQKHQVGQLCRVRTRRCRVRAFPLREPRQSRMPSLRTMSRHRKLCRDTMPGKPCHDREFSVATQTRFWAVACPFSFLALPALTQMQ